MRSAGRGREGVLDFSPNCGLVLVESSPQGHNACRGRARSLALSSPPHYLGVGRAVNKGTDVILKGRESEPSARGEKDISGLICGMARSVAKRTSDFIGINGSSPMLYSLNEVDAGRMWGVNGTCSPVLLQFREWGCV